MPSGAKRAARIIRDAFRAGRPTRRGESHARASATPKRNPPPPCGPERQDATHRLVRLLVHLLERVALDLLLDKLRELRLVPVGVLLLKQLHVLGYVAAENVLFVRLTVKLLGLLVVAGEALRASA